MIFHGTNPFWCSKFKRVFNLIKLPHSVPKGPKSGRASLKTRKGRASLKTRKGRASLKTRKGRASSKTREGLVII
jgi:hypothetical protein